VKVRITSKVHHAGLRIGKEHKVYSTGDLVEIEESQFDPSFMEKVAEFPELPTMIEPPKTAEAKIEEVSEKPVSPAMRRQVKRMSEEP